MSDGDWTWELAPKAQDDLAAFDPDEQDRILDKLDEIVDSPWRDPPDYGEPLQNQSTEESACRRVPPRRDVPAERTAHRGCSNQAPWWSVHR